MAPPPSVNRRIIEALLEVELRRAQDRRLVLVHGRYEESSTAEFALNLGGRQRRIRVTDQQSVLGIIDAWQRHQAERPDGDDVLVVTTGVDDSQLGWDLRGYAVGRATRTVDRAEIVKQRFGATDIDARIRREAWLVDALLDAEPASGWRRSGSVLTRDAAVRALIGARLGTEDPGEGALDVGALLAWSRSPAGPARFAGLPEPERAGLTAWLTETVGDAAPVLMGLASSGRAADAMALGVIGAVIRQPEASSESAAYGGLLGSVRSRPQELRAFVEAVEGTLERWVTVAESGGPQSEAARQRVLDVMRRADELAADVDLTGALAANPFLPSGFQVRLRTFAGTLSPAPDAAAVTAAATARVALDNHCIARLYPERRLAAAMAVRLVRWLAAPAPSVDSVAGGVAAHLADYGWVDRALSAVWAGESVGDPVVGHAYRGLYQAVRARRDALDEAFARRLGEWATHASAQASDGCLLVEDVLETVALPLVGAGAPLVVVLDGMSSAVAAELGEQVAGRAWTEVSSASGRRVAAVAAIPSVTRVSRASLLTAGLTVGDQQVEKDGFAAFWRKHHRDGMLFHKREIGGLAGHRLAEPLYAALSGDGVVGVVLNTIDDALDHGREGDRTAWRLTDITYLPELLDAARSYARPVVLLADHGHVLERSPAGEGPVAVTGVESARWRTGAPEPGEVELAGPRVLYGNGRIVAPWREDIRYTPRKSGYHGGASLAEMTVPVVVLLPSPDLLPPHWSVLPVESIAPQWWAQQRPTEPALPSPPPVKRSSRSKASRSVEQSEPLFAMEPVATVTAPETLGSRVVATAIYASQRAFVRKAPDKNDVAAVIDALAAADGTLSLTAAAAKAGRAGRNPEGFAATLERLLDVEGYLVVSVIDGGRTLSLDVGLLREQFGLGES